MNHPLSGTTIVSALTVARRSRPERRARHTGRRPRHERTRQPRAARDDHTREKQAPLRSLPVLLGIDEPVAPKT